MAKKQDNEEVSSLPANDAWTGMLIVAFLALSVGTGFLAWDYMQYSTEAPKSAPPTAKAPKTDVAETPKELPKIDPAEPGKDQPEPPAKAPEPPGKAPEPAKEKETP